MLNDGAKKRLERMTRTEQRTRFLQLRDQLGLAEPRKIAGGQTHGESYLEEHEEYDFLKKLLDFNN
jgi:hypothetical protein